MLETGEERKEENEEEERTSRILPVKGFCLLKEGAQLVHRDHSAGQSTA